MYIVHIWVFYLQGVAFVFYWPQLIPAILRCNYHRKQGTSSNKIHPLFGKLKAAPFTCTKKTSFNPQIQSGFFLLLFLGSRLYTTDYRLGFPRDGTFRCPLVPGQKKILSWCPFVPGQQQEQMSRDKVLCPEKSQDKIYYFF